MDTSVPLNYYTVFKHIQDTIPKGKHLLAYIIRCILLYRIMYWVDAKVHPVFALDDIASQN